MVHKLGYGFLVRTWKTWLGVALVTATGLSVGAGVVRAIIGGQRRKRSSDPDLIRAVEETLAKGRSGSLHGLTDRAYRLARPGCPTRLDPDDPTHEQCIAVWLEVRDLVAARLPPPVIESADGVVASGPAADIRTWLASLTPEQRSGLREIVGTAHYDRITARADAGDDPGTVDALLDLKDEMDGLNPLAAMRRYAELKSLLGPKLDDFIRIAEKHRP